MQSRRQFEYDVVLDSKLDSNSAISNWIGLPPSRVRLLGSPAPYWCSVCPSWSSSWFLRTIKSLDSNRLSILYVKEHKNEFTWWFNCCARDHVIEPTISTEGIIVAEVLMSSSEWVWNELKPCGYLHGMKFAIFRIFQIFWSHNDKKRLVFSSNGRIRIQTVKFQFKRTNQELSHHSHPSIPKADNSADATAWLDSNAGGSRDAHGTHHISPGWR
jgi:hypothetical protein